MRRNRTPGTSRRGKQRGVAAVEFALVLPLLLVLTFITTEFGRALYEYDSVTKAVRTAARYLTTQPYGTGTGVACPTAAENLVRYGYSAPPTGTSPLAPGLATANVQCSWADIGATPIIKTITVTVVSYPFHSIFSSAYGVTFTTSAAGTINFSDITATMRSHL